MGNPQISYERCVLIHTLPNYPFLYTKYIKERCILFLKCWMQSLALVVGWQSSLVMVLVVVPFLVMVLGSMVIETHYDASSVVCALVSMSQRSHRHHC